MQNVQDVCPVVRLVHYSALYGGSFALASASLGGFSSPLGLAVDKGAGGPVSLTASLSEEYRAPLMPGGGLGASSWEAPP